MRRIAPAQRDQMKRPPICKSHRRAIRPRAIIRRVPEISAGSYNLWAKLHRTQDGCPRLFKLQRPAFIVDKT